MIELGILADDLTGGMMVASLLEREGVECPLVSSIDGLCSIAESTASAVVVARKIRLIDAVEAQREAIQTVKALQDMGCRRFFFKYCATFDSTEKGNIGPIADAMLEALDCDHTLFCPAFPEYTVTIFQGRMFLGLTPLGESFKRVDPVTPMTNSNLVEVLQSQSRHPVGLLSHATLLRGKAAVEEHIEQNKCHRFFIADAVDDNDLARIADLALDWPLTTGADALPIFLARAWKKESNQLLRKIPRTLLPASPGGEAFIAGSCAAPTLRQLEYFEKRHPIFRINLIKAAEDQYYLPKILSWAKQNIENGPIAVSTSADTEEVKRTQNALGVKGAAYQADHILGKVSRGLFDLGVRKFIVAGGETSGQVINSLNVTNVVVSSFDNLSGGYCHQGGKNPVSFVLKAGAIGKENFVFDALERMRMAERE
jgi:uncharacterized protein YgbK (DUF1537 family)